MLTIDIRGLREEHELKAALKPAISSLRDGGIVIYPTDTVYGIGCDPRNEEALTRLLNLKGRRGKPLPILASGIEAIKLIVDMTSKAEKLARVFWPGPLTMVLPLKSYLPVQVTMGKPKVGVRIPNSMVARILAENIGGLIVGTSANKTGEREPKSLEEVDTWLLSQVDVAINGGSCPLGVPSMVVEVDGEVRVIREGAIKTVDLHKVLRDD
ncbi:MAG: L-threonylcarbamoyladenylate synthase [Candidatus Nezhaarchaeales archaeon]